MDKVCLGILNKITENHGGGYAIYSFDELAEKPDGSTLTADELSQAIFTLAEQKYIDVKYSRGDMYCIAALKECPAADVEVISEAAKAEAEPDYKRLYIVCGALAFAGAFLGAFIVCIIFAAVG